jgi:hypothetical protein
MELTPGQQRVLFAVIVIVLAGLGIFVLSSRHNGTTATPAPSPTTAPPASGASSSSAAAAASASASSVPPATVPPAPPPATTASGANIYEWLPFSQSDLTAASKATITFASDYVNWSYTETKAAYGAKLASVATPQEVTTLEFDQFGTAAATQQMVTDKQVSTGSGTIESISSFGASPTSITFSVNVTQKLASTTGTKTSAPTYAITAISTGTGWQVSNIQLSTVGNQ